MSSMYELSNLLAILAVGRNPEWTEQVDGSGDPDYDGAPSSPTSGVSLGDAVQAMVAVKIRRKVHCRSVIVTPGTIDGATTYTITVDGNAVSSTGASLAALLADIVADIAANVTVNALVSASAYDADGDGTNESVLIEGRAEADYSIGVSVSGGTGTISAAADPSEAVIRLYAMGASPNAPGRTAVDPDSGDPGVWLFMNGASYSADYRGFMERFAVPAAERLYVELDDVAGHASDSLTNLTYTPQVWIGPCVEESDE